MRMLANTNYSLTSLENRNYYLLKIQNDLKIIIYFDNNFNQTCILFVVVNKILMHVIQFALT